jgi:Domain of unknown function (DUF4402)
MKFLLVSIVFAFSSTAQAECRLCAPDASKAAAAVSTPLRIEVEAALDLGRAAQIRAGGSGTISLDPKSGERRVAGGLADLGGLFLKGTVRLKGEPFAPISVSMPNRIPLSAPDGSKADVIDIRTDLSPNVTLDAQGQLTFAFGGRLVVTAGQSGDFRGRIAISADYR